MVDLVEIDTKLEIVPLHFFEKFDPKVEKFKNSFKKTSYKTGRRASAWGVAAVAALYNCAKFHELLSRVNRLKEMRVFGLSRFSAHNPGSGRVLQHLYLENLEG